jgi:hypothetical protein
MDKVQKPSNPEKCDIYKLCNIVILFMWDVSSHTEFEYHAWTVAGSALHYCDDVCKVQPTECCIFSVLMS